MSILLGTTCLVIGCNEIIKPDEQLTVLDVVGEPSDPIADGNTETDIVGGSNSESDSTRIVTGFDSDVPLDASTFSTEPDALRTAEGDSTTTQQ